ncbi:transcription antitermination factor NusB [Micrococcus lylae]|uniref:Transcription antitermination protein NusB n=1 Tax=Micrococcus lylae TaxID=1273 RepID=A0A1R4IAF6_9MICC|nr:MULTISPECIES: transcription antitermination factor NusB [Micrococcus]MCT2006494.1 transcription antitermination factor NusB [Micrococcus lylae]MCT2070965.1 transcription antitermination factor NusB [Micrococcus lylae]OFR90315.1 N utilization substance protein B [Micrococcus sp. HMSC067E09]PNL18086.1 transcription antitermination factor NusB [Micrococcus sp. FDAARGOS_333]TFH99780.1 transcription antitermination factor NusB [Micrococcus lylae]
MTESASSARRGGTARSRSRLRAVEILFEAEQRGTTPDEGIRARVDHTDLRVNAYAQQVIDGVITEQERLDEALTSYSRGWSLDRMPAVDRVILRVGAWELLFNDEVPDGVAVAEAVTLAQQLSTDESPEFVNGLLGRLQQVKPTLLA